MAALYNAHGQCPSINRAKIPGYKDTRQQRREDYKYLYTFGAARFYFAVFAPMYLAYRDVGKGREQERKLLREVSLRE